MTTKTMVLLLVTVFSSGLVNAAPSDGTSTRVLPKGELPKDARLGPLRHLSRNYFPFRQVESLEAWKSRAENLRRQVEVATGLWPRPTRTPLGAVIHSPVVRDDYTVSRVYFESFPGHLVTGSLYRPKNKNGRLPAVVSPHGHFPEGRFHAYSDKELKGQISIGAERFLAGGRHPIQSRCVQLARMGCVVFLYDMDGYADSVQRVDHRNGVRKHMNSKQGWGLASPQAELQLQNLMGLQTWNSVRALDFVSNLPDVDPKRIAVTGASGGGTQTFILMAVDERPTAAVPCVMVSTGMQGGCNCENAPYLRIGAGNIDLAALAAPRPMGLTAADDWTVELEAKGYPDLVNIYSMYGQQDGLRAVFHTEFKHNYNSVNRMFMYGCMNDFLNLGYETPILERDFVPLSKEESTVWTKEHPAPTGDQIGETHEKAMLRWWAEDSQQQLDGNQEAVAGAWEAMIGQTLEDVGEVDVEVVRDIKLGDYSAQLVLLDHKSADKRLPAMIVRPKSNDRIETVLWLSDTGKTGLINKKNEPNRDVKKLLEAGYTVVGVDLLYQGEFLADGGKLAHQPMNNLYPQKNHDTRAPWELFSGYTYGYNLPLFSSRVQDVLTAIRAFQAEKNPSRLHLVGQGSESGAIALAARLLAGDAVARTVAATEGFRFASVTEFDDPMFLPGAVKYGDVERLVQLADDSAGDSAGDLAGDLAGDSASEEVLWLDDHDSSDTEATIAAWILR